MYMYFLLFHIYIYICIWESGGTAMPTPKLSFNGSSVPLHTYGSSDKFLRSQVLVSQGGEFEGRTAIPPTVTSPPMIIIVEDRMVT